METLNAQQVAEMLGMAKRTFLQNYAPRPDFPPRIRISQKLQFWNKEEVLKWKMMHQESSKI